MTDATPGASVYYFLNGGSATRYTGPITVSASATIQAVGVNFGGGTYTLSPYNTQTYTIQAAGSSPTPGSPAPSGSPAWTQLATLPSLFSTQGGILVNIGDGNLYGYTTAGTAPNRVNSVFVASQSNLSKWINITSPSLSHNGTESPHAMGKMPNGTVLMTQTGAGVADVFYWNGSTTSPAWTLVNGYGGTSSSSIYEFTNDSAGYTYFSPAWSGDIWRNVTPNSTNFSKVLTNMYSVTNGGGSGHPASGGIYQMHVWNLGSGDTLWAGGEGELDELPLNFSSSKSFLTIAQGFKGNFIGLDKSPTTILAQRTDASGNDLVKINPSTLVQTTVSASAAGYPGFMDTNSIGGLKWIYGTKWMMNNDRNGTAFLLFSQDDGSTWKDITTTGGLPSACTGANLGNGAIVVGQYIIARCQGGKEFWMYGPV